jgi:hypothetical protein
MSTTGRIVTEAIAAARRVEAVGHDRVLALVSDARSASTPSLERAPC